MLEFNTQFGRHVNRRLRHEQIIWLTTVASQNTPQARPVWFHWDGETVLIFSEKGKAKLRDIARNPRVALNFNTDEEGDDVVVLMGEARIAEEAPENRVKSYLRKYIEGINSLEISVEQFRASFSVPIFVTPLTMRGFIE